ncbi:MAG TPA: hypothetical protein PKD37_00345 [Oligoflexia bacterium]|nr:hypothetical protein [Oligoflexia bacterium]HMP26430.1 hypothetical protein [Oligoflexia bacterium]
MLVAANERLLSFNVQFVVPMAPRTATEQEYNKAVRLIERSSGVFNMSFFNTMGSLADKHSLSNLRVEITMTTPEIAQGFKFVIARSEQDQKIIFKINALIGDVPFNQEQGKQLFQALSSKIKEKARDPLTLEEKILATYEMFLGGNERAQQASLPNLADNWRAKLSAQ